MEYLIAIGLGVIAIILSFLKGNSSGKDSANIEVQQKVLDNVQVAKEISDDINSLSDDDVRDRLLNHDK
jgi:hypothetical protein